MAGSLIDQCFDTTHRAVTKRTIDWVIEKAIYVDEAGTPCPRESTRRAYVAATYAYLVAPPPSQIGRGVEKLDDPVHAYYLVSLLLVVLFILDDYPTAEQRRSHSDCLRAYRSGTSEKAEDDAGKRALWSFLREVDALCESSQWFFDRYDEMIEYFAREQELDLESITEQQVREFRDITVGIPAYTALWEMLCGIQLSKRPPLVDRYRRLTSELVFIADDFFSLERDLRGSSQDNPDDIPDMNIIVTRAQQRQLSIAETKRSLVLEYNESVEAFNGVRRQLALHEDEHVRRYARVLARIVNGNITAHGFLSSTRYTIEPEVFMLRQVDDDLWPTRDTK